MADQKNLNSFPTLSERTGIAMIAISALIMSFNSFIAVIPILIFYAIWFSRIFHKGQFILTPTLTMMPLAFLMFVCVFSFFWSQSPGDTLYYSLAFSSMIVSTIIIARIISLESFIKGCTVGIGLVLLITLMSGRYKEVYGTGEYALVGFFGQKNVVGAIATYGFFLSFLFFFYAKNWKEKLFFSATPTVLSLLCLHLSISKTALVAAIVSIGVLGFAYLITLFPKGLRLTILLLSAFGCASITLFTIGIEFDVFAFILEAMNKNPSLTGRTVIWDLGLERALEKPFLGWGYQGFWQEGNPHAEQYWKYFAAPSQKGFHFHNLFVQAFVELGILGLGFFLFVFIFGFGKSIALILNHGMIMSAVFFLGFMSVYFVRAMAEVELMGPFGIQIMIFYTLFLKLLDFRFEDIETPLCDPDTT